MAYEPPANASLWQTLLADEEGFVTSVATALDEYGPESHVTVSIRRLSALPTYQAGNVWFLSSRPDHDDDIAVEWKLDMVDDIGETDHVEAQLKAARAMAAGLNGALANAGDWNRSTEMAAAFHDLGDKIAAFGGALPSKVNMYFSGLGSAYGLTDQERVADVDALAAAVDGQPGTPKQSHGGIWEHRALVDLGPLHMQIYTSIQAPASEDPDVLKARIAELEAKLAGGAQ